MNTTKMIGKIEEQTNKLRMQASKERSQAISLRASASEQYALPDRAMEFVQKVVSYLYLWVKKLNAVAYRKAQDLTRQAGAMDEMAERAFHVADRFDELTK